jgi:hypothetical protein
MASVYPHQLDPCSTMATPLSTRLAHPLEETVVVGA